MMIRIAAIVIIIAIAWWINRPDMEVVVVERVIDGDTAVLEDGRKIRLLQINAPEKGQCGYQEAYAELDRLIENTVVRIESEPRLGDKDKYGRLLRYVHRGDMNVNVHLQQKGFVDSMFYNGDHGKYAYLFTGIGSCAN
jgi:endonuclease YncB( thermonuclease family)